MLLGVHTLLLGYSLDGIPQYNCRPSCPYPSPMALMSSADVSQTVSLMMAVDRGWVFHDLKSIHNICLHTNVKRSKLDIRLQQQVNH